MHVAYHTKQWRTVRRGCLRGSLPQWR